MSKNQDIYYKKKATNYETKAEPPLYMSLNVHNIYKITDNYAAPMNKLMFAEH